MELMKLVFIGFAALLAGLLLQRPFYGRSNASSYPQRAPLPGDGQPCSHTWCRYHIRYYPMALLLIAFEMEMMFMCPWAVVYVAEGVKAMAEMGMFLTILAMGILYAWREGVFRWQ